MGQSTTGLSMTSFSSFFQCTIVADSIRARMGGIKLSKTAMPALGIGSAWSISVEEYPVAFAARSDRKKFQQEIEREREPVPSCPSPCPPPRRYSEKPAGQSTRSSVRRPTSNMQAMQPSNGLLHDYPHNHVSTAVNQSSVWWSDGPNVWSPSLGSTVARPACCSPCPASGFCSYWWDYPPLGKSIHPTTAADRRMLVFFTSRLSCCPLLLLLLLHMLGSAALPDLTGPNNLIAAGLVV